MIRCCDTSTSSRMLSSVSEKAESVSLLTFFLPLGGFVARFSVGDVGVVAAGAEDLKQQCSHTYPGIRKMCMAWWGPG